MSASRRITVDMEATRLVFVMLKGAKPMRKVAIPITDTTSWHAFENQTGEVVTSLSQLQDIDQLHVIEAADVPVAPQPPQVTARQHTGVEMVSTANGLGGALPQSSGAVHPDEDGNAKYIKKKGVFNSFLSGFRQGSLLPVTTRDSELPGPRRSRRPFRVLSLRNITILLCAALVFLWFFRVFYQSTGSAPLLGQEVQPPPVRRQDEQAAFRRPVPRKDRARRDTALRAPDERRGSDRQAESVENVARAQEDTDTQRTKAD